MYALQCCRFAWYSPSGNNFHREFCFFHESPPGQSSQQNQYHNYTLHEHWMHTNQIIYLASCRTVHVCRCSYKHAGDRLTIKGTSEESVNGVYPACWRWNECDKHVCLMERSMGTSVSGAPSSIPSSHPCTPLIETDTDSIDLITRAQYD